MKERIIIVEGGSGEVVEKKSRFIANIRPVNNESEASAFIDEIKKKYWDARHNCSAFVIGDNNEISRCSDDGEPSGTAGRPMLEILTKEEYQNVAVVVTRYFGGVLLGTGGLIRAYSAAVKEGLNNCKRGKVVKAVRFHLQMDYNDIGKIQNLLASKSDLVEDTTYLENVLMKLATPSLEADTREKELVEITMGKIVILDKEECDIIIPV